MILAGTPTTSLDSGTSLITTEPAPVEALAPTVTGATNRVSHPINAPGSIRVLCLFIPSKLQVIVPAPIFTSDPIVASPK